MAHYRKLVVADKEYQFNIGKKFVAIKSNNETETVPKEMIGFPYNDNYIITPKMISDYLIGDKKELESYFNSCNCKNKPKHLGALPFDAEIYGKKILVVYCDDCFDRNADDI